MSGDALDDGLTLRARHVSRDIVLVEIGGELDMQTVPRALSLLMQVTASIPRHLILDLSDVTFLASSGLTLLIAAQSDRDGIHGQLHLLGVHGNRPVENPLRMVGLLERFDVAPDLNTLLAALTRSHP
jgi:anti-anti-sigma factor